MVKILLKLVLVLSGKDLDGEEFDFYEEVPSRPHPNCKCTIEIIEKEIKPKPQEQTDTSKDKVPQPVSTPTPTPQQTPNPLPAQTQKWIMPCNGPITSGFGKRPVPVPGASEYHNGWDIGVPIGTNVKAIADGTIIAVGPATGYGYWVVIDHGIINGIKVTSEYGHISKWVVNVGQAVKKGDIIAKSGNTGYSSGPHLHITIREGISPKKAVNPSKYIKINF